MVYSGAYVIFGVEVTPTQLSELFDIDEDKFDNKSYAFSDHVVRVARCWDNPDYKDSEVYLRLWEKECEMLRVFSLPCCNSSAGDLFLGIYLGNIEVCYREYIDSYESVEKYMEHLQTMMDAIKSRAQLTDLATQKIQKLIPAAKPRVYTFSNDCEHCS